MVWCKITAMKSQTITVDTNVVNNKRLSEIQAAVRDLPLSIAKTTVTNREQGLQADTSEDLVETAVWGESKWGRAKWGGDLAETLVIGESQIGLSVIGNTGDLLEVLLKVISNGSFPPQGKRDNLTDSQKRQLRDAMILHTHVREGRDIFVSDDARGFGRSGSDLRKKLVSICHTKIMSSEEFIAYCSESV